ncbi:hypothetical protein [Kineosporia babensis]|uniref:Uncharacterized protein n=1 Tax=Kineosporia babensis TaxID=499548 RepID=A0A9X1ND55_9ACTN|nr:hypothetical protein [Kineosporia babensis]MCD5310848.1 hypothetical protein [Kineosporia babensis]
MTATTETVETPACGNPQADTGMQAVPEPDNDGVLDDIEEMVEGVKRLIIQGPVAAIGATNATTIAGSAAWMTGGPAGLAVAGGTAAATGAAAYAAHRARQREKAAQAGKPDPKTATKALKEAEKARKQAERARKKPTASRAGGRPTNGGRHATPGRGAFTGLSMPSRGARKGSGFAAPKAGGGSRGSTGASRVGAAGPGRGAVRSSKPASPLSKGAGIGAGKTGIGKPGTGSVRGSTGAASKSSPKPSTASRTGGITAPSRGGSRGGGSGLLSRPGTSGRSGSILGRKTAASGRSAGGGSGKGILGRRPNSGKAGGSAGGGKSGGHAKGVGGFGCRTRGGGAHRTARGPLGRLKSRLAGGQTGASRRAGSAKGAATKGARNAPAKSSRLGRAMQSVAGSKAGRLAGWGGRKGFAGLKRAGGAAKRGYQTGRAAIRGAASARGKSPLQIARAAGSAIARQQAKHGKAQGQKLGRLAKFRRRITRTALALGIAGTVAAWRGIRTSGAWIRWLAVAAVLRALGKTIPDNPRAAREKREARKRREENELNNPTVADTVTPGPGPDTAQPERNTEAMSQFALQLKSKADEMAALASTYAPEGMVQWGEDMAGLEEVLASVASVLQVLQAGTDRLPIDPAVRNAIEPVIACQMSTAATAGEIRNVFEVVHEKELERLRNPRPNEAMWDTVNNQA